MKNKAFAFLAALVVLIASSCQNLLFQNSGQLRVNVAVPSGRSILPSDMSVATYRLSGTGPSDKTLSVDDSTTGSFALPSLAVGSWSITAQGLDSSNNVILQGSATVTIKAGETSSASIAMAPQASGSGMLSLALSWNAGAFTVQTIDATVTPSSGSATPLVFSISGSMATCSQNLAAGSYTLSITVKNSGAAIARSLTETVLIYNGRTSSASLELGSADWVPAYGVTYDGNNATSGTVPTDSNTYVAGMTVTLASNTGNLAKSGLALVGWNTSSDITGTSYALGGSMTMDSGAATLYAMWGNLAYDGNGATAGSVPVDDFTYSSGQTVTVKDNTGKLEKSGYVFSGWNTAANGSGTTYTKGSTFTKASGITTLYALWTPVYTVTYATNGATGGSAPVDSLSYLNGKTATVLDNTGSLVLANYVFAGWNTADDGSGTQYKAGDTITISSANVTLYVRWSRATASVAFSADHSFITDTTGKLWASGKNDYGQLGTGSSSTSWQYSPLNISSMNGLKAVYAASTTYGDSGWSFFLNGTALSGAGYSNNYTLGLGTTTQVLTPTQIVASGIASVGAGYTHAIMVRTNGTLMACGSNSSGELCLGTTSSAVNTPTAVSGITGVAAVRAGQNYTMILKTDGTLWACGLNTYGNLGNGTTTTVTTPVQVMSDVASVATGGFTGYSYGAGQNMSMSTMVVKKDGSLWAFGRNAYGQLGTGDTTQYSTPVQVIPSGVASVSMGPWFSMILKTDGTLWACGQNKYGVLCDGTTTDQKSPIQVMSNVASVSAGGYVYTGGYYDSFLGSVMIVKKDGSLWVCGYNRGNLGLVNTTSTLKPVQVIY